jgi:hypothetical protein
MASWTLLPVKALRISFLFLVSVAALQAQAEDLDGGDLKWKSDLRFRVQQESTWPDDPHVSQKLRFRLGVQKKVSSDLRAELRLATATSNNSMNQTLGDSSDPGFARRFLGLDLAYGEWKPLNFFNFQAGRIPQTHERPGGSQILLDSDLALEGAALSLECSFQESSAVFIKMGSSLIRENYDTYYSQALTNNMFNWGQLGVRWQQDSLTTVFGTGFFNYTSLQGMKFSDISLGGKARGNSESPPGTFKNSFIPRQYFIDFKQQRETSSLGAFVEYLHNGETRDPNYAWWTGIYYGEERWKATLAYAEVASDVVPGIFTDSDFAGGTTDTKGFVFAATVRIRKSLSFALTQYLNRKNRAFEATQYSRTHLDLTAEF